MEFSLKTSIFNKTILILFHSFFLLSLAFLFGQDIACPQSLKGVNESYLHVVSDKMIAQKDTSMIEFVGNVKATRKNSVVFADSIKIYFLTDNKNKNKDVQGHIKKIVSTGNVRYTDDERKAFADKAVYTTQDDVLVLTGKAPKLITGSSFVTGKKITLFRKQDKAIVESDSTKRVEAFFNPEDKITKKQ